MNEREIFLEAIDKESPTERAAFLDGACRHDPQLRRRVEVLIAAHEKGSTLFLDSPALDVRASVEQPIPEGTGRQIGP